MNATSEYAQVLHLILESLLPQPEFIKILENKGLRKFEISVQVHGGDHAFVIGREARMVKALQVILNHIADRNNEQAQLGVLDPQVGKRGPYTEYQEDKEWTPDKAKRLEEIYRKLIGMVIGDGASYDVRHKENTSVFDVHTQREIPVVLLTSLQTVVRAIGKSKGRNVVINCRVKIN